jgi:hypothetical protein
LSLEGEQERSTPDRCVELEFDVDEAMTAVYEGDDTL